VYQGDLLINSGMPQIAAALAAMKPVDARRWRDATRAANADYREWIVRRENPGRVQMWDVIDFLKQRVPEDAIMVTGAGNFTGWVQRFYRYPMFRTQIGPTSGAMGYGVPAGVAAKIAAPGRMVLCFNGDGDFLMNGQELATAVQYDARVIFIVINNGMYGTIRMHQEREYPGRVYGTDLRNPDFAAYARSFGAHGETVVETAEFGPAFERCVAAGKPSLIDLHLDPQAITTQMTLDAIRAKALARR
ncbi:MAG: thiamine pyrophosphate-dependent enzyme, partial [Burkholderiales bacterium]